MPASEDKENLTLPTYVDIDPLPEGIEAGRFEGDKKSSHLVAAEKEELQKKNALKALFERACKPLHQDTKIHSPRDAEKLTSIKLCQARKIPTDLYRAWPVVTTLERLSYKSHADLWVFFELVKKE